MHNKSSANFNPNQINANEIGRIYRELVQEKKRIRIQENKIRKSNNLFKKKEQQLDEEKNKIQKKKDRIFHYFLILQEFLYFFYIFHDFNNKIGFFNSFNGGGEFIGV